MPNYQVYYGEYTLYYWIQMILKREIVLPIYQRDFVWTENDVKNLMTSLSEDQYIPQIIIGHYQDSKNEFNYVLDGQQRLSAILLAWYGYFPKKEKFGKKRENFSDYNDDEYDNEDDDNVKEWSFNEIQKLYDENNNLDDYLKESDYYSKLNFTNIIINDDFMNTKKLGFAYIRPITNNSNEQKKYYSTMFRNINISGVNLTPMEIRASLYWLDEKLQPFLQPDKHKIGKIEIGTITKNKIDFARYIALLSEYHKSQSHENIAKGYGSRGGKSIEVYIENFIYDIVNKRQKSNFYIFDNDFDYKSKLEQLDKSLYDFNLKDSYNSIIEADYYLFGLIYYIIFSTKHINLDMREQLHNNVKTLIAEANDNSAHRKTPNALKYLRNRIIDSIKIYKEVFK